MQNNNKRSDGDVNDITLRDYFAAKAMNGLISSASGSDETSDNMANILFSDLAKQAYQVADAMMLARKANNVKSS